MEEVYVKNFETAPTNKGSKGAIDAEIVEILSTNLNLREETRKELQ